MSETLEIVKLGHAGDGVAADGSFVPYALPGDVVRVERDDTQARVVEIVTPGPWRVKPPCRHFGVCGGCALQHVAREPYLAWKRDLVVTALKQRGFEDVPVEDIRAVPPGTRRRAMFKARAAGNGVQLGFYEPGSRNLVDLAECPILAPDLAKLMAPLRTQLVRLMRGGETMELHATATDSGIDLALKWKRHGGIDVFTALSQFASALKLARLAWNGEVQTMAAAPLLRVGTFSVALPVESFLQPTREGERILQDLVRESLKDARRVCDLFSGCGTFALALTDGRTIHAADNTGPQIAALLAAAREGQAKVTAETRDLYRRPFLPAELARFDAVVLDPPRPGAKAQAEALAQSKVPRIAYVSCNAASFARDARILADGGYRLERVVPVDQFVWSPHVELFAAFTRP